MSILSHLRENGTFRQWGLEGNELPMRYFYYTERWRSEYESLDDPPSSNPVEASDSEKGRVAGLVNDFVRGVELKRMCRPQGWAMDPTAKRLDPPRNAVMELRTNKIRIFGFFASSNFFYAVSLMRKATRRGGSDPIDPFVAPAMALISRLTPMEVDETTDVQFLITP